MRAAFRTIAGGPSSHYCGKRTGARPRELSAGLELGHEAAPGREYSFKADLYQRAEEFRSPRRCGRGARPLRYSGQ